MRLGLHQIYTLLCPVQMTIHYPRWTGLLGGEPSCSQLAFRKALNTVLHTELPL